MKTLKKYIFLATLAVSAAAVVQELSKQPSERTWHGRILGIPYDFRTPTFERFRSAWWNPEDARIFTPRDFGVGWSINIPTLMRRWREETQTPSEMYEYPDERE